MSLSAKAAVKEETKTTDLPDDPASDTSEKLNKKVTALTKAAEPIQDPKATENVEKSNALVLAGDFSLDTLVNPYDSYDNKLANTVYKPAPTIVRHGVVYHWWELGTPGVVPDWKPDLPKGTVDYAMRQTVYKPKPDLLGADGRVIEPWYSLP